MVRSIVDVLESYCHSTKIKNIIKLLNDPKKQSYLFQDWAGAQLCFVLSAVFKNLNRDQLFIANTKEDAAYIQNTLSEILKECEVHFFPDSFRRPAKFEEIDKHNAVQRIEIVNKIFGNLTGSSIVVTYPEAIFEKVVHPEVLLNSRIDVKVNEKLDIDTAVDILVEFGFERVDFVYEPGQFSIRGGIVDIFSFGNEWPYRVELFDEEVESIRSFDPSTQLSIRKIGAVRIVPNVHQKFSQQDKTLLTDILSVDTFIWIQDNSFLLEKVQDCFENLKKFSETLEFMNNEELKKIVADRAFEYPGEILRKVKAFKNVHLSLQNPLPDNMEIVSLKGKAQPVFNKNFSLLAKQLKDNSKISYENYIFSDNPKQIDRFKAIFRDIDPKVQFHAIHGSIHSGFSDEDLKIACYTDHQIFERFHRYKLKQGFTKDQAISLKLLRELQPGDYVVHIDHGVGKYSGLEKIEINGHAQESVRLIYQNNDILYVSIHSLHKISRYIGKDGEPPRLDKIGSDAWKALKRKTKSKIKDIAKELIKLYAQRKASQGFAFEPDNYLQTELEASFIYEDTPDQYKATQEVKEDMMKSYPMDRLICGDVGFGKTEVAVRAAFKAITNGKQVAVLVPTTILALQHYHTFKSRLDEFGVKINYLNRFKTTKEKKEIFKQLADGSLELIIGTHALLNKDIKFKDLGLLVIDEEQKFGVAAKEKLRSLKVNVDTLTLTATPIPRTLQFSLMAARDLSIIKTPPPNRQPIYTERRVFSEELIKEAVYYEVNRGGQVFLVHNRVKSLPDMAAMVRRMCPDVKVGIAHGQMEADKLEKTLTDFIAAEFDVLVCTNIIETGLDISNANTIIINNAHQYGMSDLHQLRGRVGRSNRKAFCYLFAPPLSVLTDEARKRLKTLEEFSDLGSGFDIAMKDLDIRGAGNLLGAEQSGFIADIGYETYQKILEEAIIELKETDFKELFSEELEKERKFVRDVEIDTDIEMLIPDHYVNSIQERLSLYKALDDISNEEDLNAYIERMRDRFGPVPPQVFELLTGIRLKWIAKSLGFEKITLKNNTLRCYFVMNPQSSYFESTIFTNLLKIVSESINKINLNLKQTQSNLLLMCEGVSNLTEAWQILNKLNEQASVPETATDAAEVEIS